MNRQIRFVMFAPLLLSCAASEGGEATQAATDATRTSPQENKTQVRRFVEEIQNRHDLELIDELVSAEFVDHSGRAVPPNRDGMKAFLVNVFAAFPDARFTVHEQLAEGDKVMTYKTFHGTHKGAFMGIPPSGNEVAFDIIDVFTVRAGKLVEHWSVVDQLALMRQIGAIPSAAP